MKTRSTHIGGWRWRARIFPWGYLLSVSWAVLMLAALVIVLVVVATGGRS
ncbi:MAG TPA: hypothetical protein VL043_12360 [Protaetiibacter sp.]|nr:hypothetical protein [Protaetiibacter sp.]